MESVVSDKIDMRDVNIYKTKEDSSVGKTESVHVCVPKEMTTEHSKSSRDSGVKLKKKKKIMFLNKLFGSLSKNIKKDKIRVNFENWKQSIQHGCKVRSVLEEVHSVAPPSTSDFLRPSSTKAVVHADYDVIDQPDQVTESEASSTSDDPDKVDPVKNFEKYKDPEFPKTLPVLPKHPFIRKLPKHPFVSMKQQKAEVQEERERFVNFWDLSNSRDEEDAKKVAEAEDSNFEKMSSNPTNGVQGMKNTVRRPRVSEKRLRSSKIGSLKNAKSLGKKEGKVEEGEDSGFE